MRSIAAFGISRPECLLGSFALGRPGWGLQIGSVLGLGAEGRTDPFTCGRDCNARCCLAPRLACPMVNANLSNESRRKSNGRGLDKTGKETRTRPAETRDFPEKLLNVAVRPEFTYVHQNRPGDMQRVENRSAMHKAGFAADPSAPHALSGLGARRPAVLSVLAQPADAA